MTLLDHLLLLHSYYNSELDHTSDPQAQAFWFKSIDELDEIINTL